MFIVVFNKNDFQNTGLQGTLLLSYSSFLNFRLEKMVKTKETITTLTKRLRIRKKEIKDLRGRMDTMEKVVSLSVHMSGVLESTPHPCCHRVVWVV